MGQTVIATMTFYRNNEELRAKLAVRTAREALKHQHRLIVVDGGSPTEFLEVLRDHGADVHPQEERGIGPAHRQLFKIAAERAGEDGAICWIEAEKWPLVAELWKATTPVLNGNAGLVLPERTEEAWHSYPPEQRLQEQFCNMAAVAITGLALDWFWGPFVASQVAIRHFVEYRDDYGGKWDARTIPRLRIIAAGITVKGVRVNYIHPPEQTAEETGVLEPFIVRRVEQVCNQVPAMLAEAKKLGIIPR